MNLKQKIFNDIKEALKKGDQERAGVLRFLNSVIHNKEIEKYAREKQSELSEEEISAVLGSEAKKRREAIEVFKRGGRFDLAEKEQTELEIIQQYLPKPLSSEEIKQEIEKILKRHPEASDFGSAMKKVMKELKGKADAKIVSEFIKAKFSG